ELRDHTRVVLRVGKEAEAGEEVQHSIEAPRPPRRQRSHVALRVAQQRARAPLPGFRDQLARIIESIDVQPRFSERMRMSTLPARAIEHACTGGERQKLHQTSDLATVALLRE